MVFVFQSTGIPMWHSEEFLNAAKELGHEVKDIGVVPFTDIVTGLEELDPSKPTFFFGSTKMLEVLAKHPDWKNQIWFNDNFDASKFDPTIRHKMLNQQPLPLRFRDLKSLVNRPVFVRPVSSLKLFPGAVINPNNIEDWLENYAHNVDPDTDVLMSEYSDIWAEWRFFIVDGVIVTGSQYRFMGRLENKTTCKNLELIASCIAEDWLPMNECVMDLALTRDGMKIVEFNCLHSSGLYGSDPKKLVEAIAECKELGVGI